MLSESQRPELLSPSITPCPPQPHTHAATQPPKDDRMGASSWERATAGGDFGADGVGGEGAPEPSDGAEANCICLSDRRGVEIVTLSEEQAAAELDEGQSPVEEEGHEVKVDEDEELGSTVEEGEEAALALDAPPLEAESDLDNLPQLPVRQTTINDTLEAGHSTCHDQAVEPTGLPDTRCL